MAAERNISDAFALLLPYTLNTCTVFIETSILRHTITFFCIVILDLQSIIIEIS